MAWQLKNKLNDLGIIDSYKNKHALDSIIAVKKICHDINQFLTEL